ncbi:hypothetical protein AC1031_002162 [Aphanomyces cochlioides]|nr:hypothetical protein AC1031_002162 [Aphanomyces cochlioides]
MARQREIILQLQKQVGELEDQLKDAKYERNQARKALQEQQELQEAVESNDSFIGKLVTLLRKRPRHQVYSNPALSIFIALM